MKAECFMENIIQEVKNGFEDINKLSSILHYDYSFDPPASYEEISDWEKDYNVRIPDMYKSWLMLTKYARIMGGEFELFFPEISKHYENAVLIGSIGCSKELLFSSDTGEIYSIEDEIDEYEDFHDFLTYVQITMEDEAEEEYGEEWLSLYDERFPES